MDAGYEVRTVTAGGNEGFPFPPRAPSNLGFNWGYSTSASPIRNTTAASSVTPPATAPSPSPPSPTGREITRELILRCIERQGVRLPTKRDAHMEDRMMLKQTHLHLHTQGLSAITRLATLLPHLSVLYLYDNNIETIDNLTGLSGLTHLYLQNNRITQLTGLTVVTRLQKLYCEGNYIQLISGLEACMVLEELHVSGQHPLPLPALPQPSHNSNTLRSFNHSQSGTDSPSSAATTSNNNHNYFPPGNSPHPPRSTSSLGLIRPPAPPLEFDPASISAIARTLKVLFCKACRLSSCVGLSGLMSLKKLDLSHNNLAHLSDLEPLLRPATCLTWLDLRSNPLCRIPKYREGVTMMNDSLVTLDGEPILAAQREFLLRLHIQKLKTQVHAELAEEQSEVVVVAGGRRSMSPGQRACESRGYSQGQIHSRGWEAGGGGGMDRQAVRRQQGGRLLSAVCVEVCGATAARANTSIPGREDGRSVRLGLEGLPVGR